MIICNLSILAAEEKKEEAETQASELLIKKRSLDELLDEVGSKGPRSAAKTREQVSTICSKTLLFTGMAIKWGMRIFSML